jgi:hypothetical protein
MTTMRLGQWDDEPTPPHTFPDFAWISENQQELVAQYGEGFVLVYEKQVLGFGATLQEAMANAERNLPPGDGEIIPVVDTIHRPYAISSVRRSTRIPLDSSTNAE